MTVASATNDHSKPLPVVFSLSEPGSARELIDEVAAASLVESLSSDDWAKVNTLRLSGKSLSIGATEVFCREAFSRIEHGALVHAYLNDMIASRPESEALHVLSAVAESLSRLGPSLETLDLSDNALGLKGINAVAPLLTSCRDSLLSLTFNNNGLEARAASQISNLMTNGSQEMTRLLKFHTFNNLLESAGAIGLSTLLAMSPMLNDLRISSTRIGADGCLAIASACSKSKAPFSRLNFADNSFMSNGMVVLAQETIANLPDLSHLNLSATAMGLEGLIALEKALTMSGAPIAYLDLSCNDLPAEAAPILGRLLDVVYDTLVEFKASENELGSAGAMAIARATRDAPKLSLLDLSVNDITESGALLLAECLPASLESLELNGNMISSSGVDILIKSCGDRLGQMDLNDDEYDEEEDYDNIDEDEDKDEVTGANQDQNSYEDRNLVDSIRDLNI